MILPGPGLQPIALQRSQITIRHGLDRAGSPATKYLCSHVIQMPIPGHVTWSAYLCVCSGGGGMCAVHLPGSGPSMFPL